METSEVFGINSGVYQRENFGSLKSFLCPKVPGYFAILWRLPKFLGSILEFTRGKTSEV
jgi:hypothetical protein